MCKPIIKWAGGKTQLLESLLEHLPTFIKEGKPYLLVEPFAGGAALTLHLMGSSIAPNSALVCDINSDLINLYQMAKQYTRALHLELNYLQDEFLEYTDNSDRANLYYATRRLFNAGVADEGVQRAAFFLFLNRTCFNGLYRLNARGEFNVPMGKYVNPTIWRKEVIDDFAKVAKKITFADVEFDKTLELLESFPKDLPVFFYLDPPYRPLSDTASFTSYTKDRFNDDDQLKLKLFCDTLNEKGYSWLMSNSDSSQADYDDKFVDNLYKDYSIHRVTANRNINSVGLSRGKVPEVLIRNY